MKILTHVMEGYENLVEVKDVHAALKLAKSRVKEVLMPGKIPGGSMEDNIGVAWELLNAKVGWFVCVYVCVCVFIVYVCDRPGKSSES